MKKICVLISGGGSNLATIIQAIDSNNLPNTQIACVIADRDCQGKYHALNANIPFRLIERKLSPDLFSQALIRAIPKDCDLIVLAGFLSIIPPEIIRTFPKKIINLHPSLLPKFGGMNMYGMNVHRAVIEAKETESGASVHYVSDEVDKGEIIEQISVRVCANDTAQDLQKRLAPLEHQLLIRVINRLLFPAK